MKGLCQVNGGNIFIEPYTNNSVLNMSAVADIRINRVIDQYVGDWVAFSNELTALQKKI